MEKISKYIDHTILNADATEKDIQNFVSKQKNMILKQFVSIRAGLTTLLTY